MIWALHGPRGCSAGDGAPAAPPPHGRGRARRLHFGPPGPGGQRAPGRGAGRGAGPRRGRALRRRRRREGGSRAATAPRHRSAWARRGASGGRGERGARHGAGLGLEADVVAVLPVPAGHRALHAGALGAHRLQYPSAGGGGAGPAGRLRGAGSGEPGSGSGQRAAGGGWRRRSRAVPVVPLRCLSVGSWVSFVCFYYSGIIFFLACKPARRGFWLARAFPPCACFCRVGVRRRRAASRPGRASSRGDFVEERSRSSSCQICLSRLEWKRLTDMKAPV